MVHRPHQTKANGLLQSKLYLSENVLKVYMSQHEGLQFRKKFDKKEKIK